MTNRVSTLKMVLFDRKPIYEALLPLTFTRPVSELLVGIDTIGAKWRRLMPGEYSWHTAEYLSELFACGAGADETVLCISSGVIPTAELVAAVSALADGVLLVSEDGEPLAMRCRVGEFADAEQSAERVTFAGEVLSVKSPTDIFTFNARAITDDFAWMTREGEGGREVSETCTIIGTREHIYIAPDATVEGVTINTTHGPVYIGPGAEVMEGSTLRGPIAILDHATVNMLTRIYPGTTIGTHCKVGGEINNVVMHPYSNKAHDGFLGNAVIGSWCNLGAGCVASNLKNDYTEIKLWNYPSRRFMRTGLQFCGLIMADHSKAGINTMFNTATVVGVGVNIHGTGFPRNFVASFQEGSATSGFTDVPVSKFLNIARRVMARRQIELTDADVRVYETLYQITETYK